MRCNDCNADYLCCVEGEDKVKMSKELRDLVINEFSTESTQKFYTAKAEEGLWESELILIKKYFKSGSSVLDIGCGTGRTTIPLSKMRYKVVGVDVTPKMIENARNIVKSKKLKIKYEIGDATSLKYKDNSFDNALFSYNGWSQIPGSEHRLKALEEAHRILKKDGIFIFTAHKRAFTRGFQGFWIKQWIRFYLLKPLGFSIDEVDFGDRFFQRGETKFKKQYIHIPSKEEVKTQINKAGFELVSMEESDKLSEAKNPDTPIMFYVCKKVK